jgi:5-methylcytosine-specific restriction endonuclease McrA
MQRKEYAKQYYLKNKEKIIKRANEYAKNNKERVKQRLADYYLKHQEKLQADAKRTHHAKPFVLKWAQGAIYRHKSVGYEVLLTVQELIDIAMNNSKCQLCGDDLMFYNGRQGKGKKYHNSVTLDRMNNEKTIHKDNILILCWKCNVTKQQRTMSEFHNYCKMIANKDFTEYEKS